MILFGECLLRRFIFSQYGTIRCYCTKKLEHTRKTHGLKLAKCVYITATYSFITLHLT
eukprot:CCRYP_018209-RA/>CCRYP_018209-RA protein AED:0.00 eAED:0.00 QI:85/1/1/1/0/0/2/0/57